MPDVKIGYGGTAILASLPAPELQRLLRAAEQAGIDHIGVGDHVSFYVGFGNDGLIKASQVLGASQGLRVVLGVYLLPLRHPTTVARQLADLSQLAPGRLTFGVGVGGEDPAELENCGVDPRTRGRRMDESLDVLRALLTQDQVDHDGQFFTLRGASIAPRPSTPVPLIVGGRSDAAIHRAATRGDGWFGIWVSARRYGEIVEQMTVIAEAARGVVPVWQNAINIWCGVGGTHEAARARVAPAMEAFYQLPFDRFERWSPYGTPDDLAEFVAPYVEAGCHEFNLMICGGDADEEIAAVADVKRLLA